MESSSSIDLRDSSLGNLAGFWDYVARRHEIWRRKEILQKDPPWTDDPILQTFHFCNVYREYDKGTIWYINYVRNSLYGWDGILWQTICYRLVNMIPAFEATGGIAPRALWRSMLQAWRDKGIKLNSAAYLTLSRPIGKHNRIDRLEYVLEQLDSNFNELVHNIAVSNTLEQVSFHLKEQYGIGPFLSLQIYRDLILVGHLDFNDDDWVEMGPGAKKGLTILFGDLAKGEKARRELCYGITQVQEAALIKRGIWEYEAPNLKLLSVCEIEHNLCEFAKYTRLKAGEGRRRYYRR